MCSVTRINFILFALIVFFKQNAEAISFATDYIISINGQQTGTLKRSINSEGHVTIDIHFMASPEAQGLSGEQLDYMITSGQCVNFEIILNHLQSLLSGSSSAASPTQNNEISMTITESAGHLNSISYHFLGQTAHYSEADQAGDIGHSFIHGTEQAQGFNPGEGFNQLLPQLTSNDEESGEESGEESDEEDEGVELTIQDEHTASLGTQTAGFLSDAHGEEVTDSVFLFGQRFEQLLTTLVEAQSHSSGLLNLISIFPILVTLPGQPGFGVVPAGYGQELIYDPASNMFTQQDPADDPNPCGETICYQLNSNGVISSITIHDGGAVVTFSSENITQATSSSSASLPNSNPALLISLKDLSN